MGSKVAADIEISKNLLQMNFMRRTAISREKPEDEQTNNVLDPEKWAVQLPEHIKSHLKKVRELKPLKGSSTVHYLPSLFSVLNIPPGGRLSFRGFNPSVERMMANQAALLAEQAASGIGVQPEVTHDDAEVARHLSAIKRKSGDGGREHRHSSSKKRQSKKENKEDPEDGELVKKRHKKHRH